MRKSSLSHLTPGKNSKCNPARQNTVKPNHKRKSSLKKAPVSHNAPASPQTCRREENVSDGLTLSLIVEESRRIDPADKLISFQSDEDVLAWCAAILNESPLASAMIEEAVDKGWSFGLDDLKNGGFHLDIPDRFCRIDHHSMTPLAFTRSAHFRNAALMAFARALRDIWHEARLGDKEEELLPESILMLERLRSADGDIVAVAVAWELRCAGHADIWRYVIGSEDGDIAMAFSKKLDSTPAPIFDGPVMSHAFRQWFADDQRVNLCDHETLEYLDGMIERSGNGNPFGRGRLTGTEVENISLLPDGRSCLAGLGESILCDPFYCGFRDEVNKAHLAHISYDLQVVMVNNVPFRDESLARLIFPESETVTAE